MAHRGVPYQNLYYLLTSMHMSSMYDIAVVGGGPAGSTAAAFLSRADRRVIVFESEKFPLFHMGESLLPLQHESVHVMSHITARRAVATTFLPILAIACFCVTSCVTTSHHTFSEPNTGWQTKTGQLMYRTQKTTLIGEALVRFSARGDFELTVSKGPGIALLSLRQDTTFAEAKGAFARQGWSGPINNAPAQLRGWLGLRDQFVRAPNQKTLRYTSGDETFLFRF